MLVRIISNKIYSCGKDCIVFSALIVKWVEIAKNEILKNNGSGIYFCDMKGINNDPAKVMVRNNTITESQTGYGVLIENTSCTLEHNEIKKNVGDGIYITTGFNIEN